MKKVLVLMLVTAMLAITSLVFAGGGQNCNAHHAEEAGGNAWSNHESGVCPWGVYD